MEMGYHGLIQKKAPYVHPMGSFWLIPQVDIAGMVAHKGLTLRYAPFALEVHTSGNVESSDEMLQVANSATAKKRKWSLELEIASLKSELECKVEELKRLTSVCSE